jgi:sulfotransferase famil protein
MRKCVFVHLPKTAGSSFRMAVRKTLGEGAVCPDFIATRLTEADAARLDRFPVISGHISMADVKRYFPDRMILTILRDPIDRCLSWYYFARKKSTRAFASDFVEAKRNSIEDFFALDYKIIYRNIYNRQVRQLGDHVLNVDADLVQATANAKEALRSAVWVGRQDNLAADIERLGEVVPELAGLSLPSFNVTGDRKAQDELAPELIDRIRALNEYDIDLYKFATQGVSAPA